MPPRCAKCATPDVVSLHAQEQLQPTVHRHKHLGLHRDGGEQRHDRSVGEHHPVSQQQAEQATGCAHRRIAPTAQHRNQQLTRSGSQHAGQQELHVPAWPPDAFQFAAKHPQAHHVEEDVTHRAMHEGISHHLPGHEVTALEWPQSHELRQHMPQRQVKAEQGHIDQEQGLGDRGQRRHAVRRTKFQNHIIERGSARLTVQGMVACAMLSVFTQCPGGEIGRRAGFKIRSRKGCRFDSGPGHHSISSRAPNQGLFLFLRTVGRDVLSHA